MRRDSNRDREELIIGLMVLVSVPVLLGVFPEMIIYIAMLGAIVLFGWLFLLGMGVIIYHAAPALLAALRWPFRRHP